MNNVYASWYILNSSTSSENFHDILLSAFLQSASGVSYVMKDSVIADFRDTLLLPEVKISAALKGFISCTIDDASKNFISSLYFESKPKP